MDAVESRKDKQEATSVSGAARVPDAQQISRQVEKLLASSAFQHADSIRQLLEFLGQRAVSHPGNPVKEIELATSVFGLSLDHFDPKIDSTIRVRVGRLRSKLLEYYSGVGSEDDVVLEIPKGAYFLVGRLREPHLSAPFPEAEDTGDAALLPTSAPDPSSPASHRRRQILLRTALWLPLLAACFLAGYFANAYRERTVPAHLQQFWKTYSAAGAPRTIAYSNPRLVGHLWTEGLRYEGDSAAEEGDQHLNLGYSGSGDVPSVRALTRFFDRMHWDASLESGARLSWDTARNSNLIFLGRPEQNPALQKMSRLSEFYFRSGTGIANAHPAAGEAATYPSDKEYDYAMIAFTPGINGQNNTLILAGDTTLGTQAAAECVTSESCMADLLARLQVKPRQKVPHFEALLKVKINNDVPVWSSILSVRLHSNAGTAWQIPAANER